MVDDNETLGSDTTGEADEYVDGDAVDDTGGSNAETDAGSGAEPDADTADIGHDPGLTGQLRALRLEEPEEHPGDEPMWGFERAAYSDQGKGDVDSGEADRTAIDAELGAGLGAVMFAARQAEDSDGAEPPVEPERVERGGETAAESGSDDDAPSHSETLSAGEEDDEDEAAADVADEVAIAAVVADDEGDDDADTLDDAAAAAATVPAAALSDDDATIPREIDLGPERRSRRWPWVAAAVAVVLAAGLTGYAWWWSTARPVTVPDVTGKRPGDATQALNDSGLRLGTLSEKETSAAPPGTIVIQDPAAGVEARPGDAVSLTVATSPDAATVPDLTGTTLEDAEKTLARVRLRGYVVASYSTTVAADAVMGQVPVGGQDLPAGSTVAIVVSKGAQPASVTVPNLAGLTEDEAVRLVAASDLRPEIYRSADASVTTGMVSDQTPASRTAVAPQATVLIGVSEGKRTAPLTVPRVVGSTQDAALKAIRGAKLKASVLLVPSRSVPKGKVISQMPDGGKKSAADGVVGVLVSAGDSVDVTVPSVVGTDTAGAESAIAAAALTPVVLEVEITGAPAGTVFSQFPSAGVSYRRYFPMIALVAKGPAL